MALEGTLRDFSLADIFQLIGLQRKTGVLTLRGKDGTVTVTFLDGKVVSAESLDRRLENRLGTVLIRNGMLSSEQLARALEIQKETLQRLGFILTQYGFISPEDLRSAIQHQILQTVYRLFRWKDGDYHFSQETTIEYDRENIVPITAESILMEGARMIDEWPIIERKIRSFDMVFRHKNTELEIQVVHADDADEVDFGDHGPSKKKAPPSSTEKIRISEAEKATFDLVDGHRSVGDIIEMSRLSEFDTSKALYELLTRDLIEEVRTAPAALRQPAVEEVEEVAPVEDDSQVPLLLVIGLSIWVIISLATSIRNPINLFSHQGRRSSSIIDARKAISFQRMLALRKAIEAYHLTNGQTPAKLGDLVPNFASSDILEDPWGNPYKYMERTGRYLVIGFAPDGRPDTDLFLSQLIDTTAPPPAGSKTPTGGIQLVE